LLPSGFDVLLFQQSLPSYHGFLKPQEMIAIFFTLLALPTLKLFAPVF
jgi:hypothetical protein